MSDNKQSLVSIIKIEPEEFQETKWNSELSLSGDDILRFNANIFLDPIVHLERLTTKSSQIQKAGSSDSRLKNLLKKGNEGLAYVNPHTCSLCGKVLRNRYNFKNHLNIVHFKTTKMFCDLCSKICFSIRSMKDHMTSVHGKKKFTCNICDFKAFARFVLQKHKLVHASKVECSICHKQVISLKQHMEWHKPKEKCSICHKMYSHLNRSIHMKVHTRKAYKCESCDMALDSKETLRRHNLLEHYNGKIFKCHCGSVHKSLSHLKNHQRIHNNEKVACEVCPKQFATRNYLKVHWNSKHQQKHGVFKSKRMTILSNTYVHPSVKYICDKCGSELPNRRCIRDHFKKFHQFIKKYCDLCPQSFNQKCYLAYHIETKHLNLSHDCNICGYKSFYKSSFRQHMLLHGQKTECKICHKLVTNVKSHLRSHVKANCPICGKTMSEGSLLGHKKRRHQ